VRRNGRDSLETGTVEQRCSLLQRSTAMRVFDLVHRQCPGCRLVVGRMKDMTMQAVRSPDNHLD
jgi:hypothetical protein